MYRGILPQSDSDWGEFLYTFDLGLLSLVFDTHPLYLEEDVCRGRGERGFSRSGSGALTTFVGCWGGLVDKTRQEKTRQDQDTT